MRPDALRARWDRLLAGAEPAPRGAALADLVTRHGEPARHYHTLDHVGAVLDALDRLGATTPATELAAWFHDAVYDPAAADNEARSAALARRVLPGLGVDPGVTAETARLIGLTRDHAVAPGDAAGAALVDADLSVLGSPPAAYDQYAAAVRAEYAHVSDTAWRTGRAALLRAFLERPALFRSPAGRRRWERPARANLRRELDALGAVSGGG